MAHLPPHSLREILWALLHDFAGFIKPKSPEKVRASGVQLSHYFVGCRGSARIADARSAPKHGFSPLAKVRIGSGSKKIVGCSASRQSEVICDTCGIDPLTGPCVINERTQHRQSIEGIITSGEAIKIVGHRRSAWPGYNVCLIDCFTDGTGWPV